MEFVSPLLERASTDSLVSAEVGVGYYTNFSVYHDAANRSFSLVDRVGVAWSRAGKEGERTSPPSPPPPPPPHPSSPSAPRVLAQHLNQSGGRPNWMSCICQAGLETRMWQWLGDWVARLSILIYEVDFVRCMEDMGGNVGRGGRGVQGCSGVEYNGEQG